MTKQQQPYVAIGQRIAARRSELGRALGKKIRQADVADQVGVAPGTVTAWEIGKQRPEGQNLVSLATFLEASPGWILGDEQATPQTLVATDAPEWFREMALLDARAAADRAATAREYGTAARLEAENARLRLEEALLRERRGQPSGRPPMPPSDLREPGEGQRASGE